MIKKHLEIPGTNENQNTNGSVNTTTNSGGEAGAASNIQQDVPITASERNELIRDVYRPRRSCKGITSRIKSNQYQTEPSICENSRSDGEPN